MKNQITKQQIKENLHWLIFIRSNNKLPTSSYSAEFGVDYREATLSESYAIIQDKEFMWGLIGDHYAHNGIFEAIGHMKHRNESLTKVNFKKAYHEYRLHNYECYMSQEMNKNSEYSCV